MNKETSNPFFGIEVPANAGAVPNQSGGPGIIPEYSTINRSNEYRPSINVPINNAPNIEN